MLAALAFHKTCLDWLPLQAGEWNSVEDTVVELEDTLKTILCL